MILEKERRGRLPRQDGPGDAPPDQRDQGRIRRRRPRRRRRRDRRGRRYGGRHREPAVPGGHPPVPGSNWGAATWCTCTWRCCPTCAPPASSRPSRPSTRVDKLREIGIQPDMLICRSERRLDDGIREKTRAVLQRAGQSGDRGDRRRAHIYEMPARAARRRASTSCCWMSWACPHARAICPPGSRSSRRSCTRAPRCGSPSSASTSELTDAYRAIYESLTHGGHRQPGPRPSATASPSHEIEREGAARLLAGAPRALGAGRVRRARGARARSRRSATRARHELPFFGICLGMQCAVDRVRPPRARAHRGPLDRVRRRHPAPGHRPAGGTARRGRPGRDHAARRLSLPAHPGHPHAAGLRDRRGLRAPPAPLRVQQRPTASGSNRPA
ncbi:MAG: hypothetical protein KatS3mg102_1941 [Planctomycetota bacterium]|nr:MAG: hypothetical protein KatS3mg102_1941 [Planctomycetota bacterium]